MLSHIYSLACNGLRTSRIKNYYFSLVYYLASHHLTIYTWQEVELTLSRIQLILVLRGEEEEE